MPSWDHGSAFKAMGAGTGDSAVETATLSSAETMTMLQMQTLQTLLYDLQGRVCKLEEWSRESHVEKKLEKTQWELGEWKFVDYKKQAQQIADLERAKKESTDKMQVIWSALRALEKNFEAGDRVPSFYAARGEGGQLPDISSPPRTNTQGEPSPEPRTLSHGGLPHPPGLGPPKASSRLQVSCSTPLAPARAPATSSLVRSMSAPETEARDHGIRISMVEVDGETLHRAEWRIEGLQQKLADKLGKPLISPLFFPGEHGQDSYQLMACPELQDPDQGMRTRKQKDRFINMVKEGPLHGSLKLKAIVRSKLEFYVTIGTGDALVRRGPITHDYSDSTVAGCPDLELNWLDKVDQDDGASLTFGVELRNFPLTLSV